MKYPFFQNKPFYFRHLFIRITAFVSFMIVLLSLSLFYNFRNYSLQAINNSNEKILSELGSNSTRIDNHMRIYSQTLANNLQALDLMTNDNLPLIDTLNNIKALNSTLYTTPFIFSVYFYNGKTNTFFTVGGDPIIRKKEEFYDHEIVKILDGIPNRVRFDPISRRIPSSDNLEEEHADVYTYVIPNISLRENVLNYAVVVNVKIDSLFSVLRSSEDFDDTNTSFLVLSEKGTVLGDSGDELHLKSAIDIPYIKDVFKFEKPSGYFITKVNGVKSVITYVNIDANNWKFLSITPYKNVSKAIDRIQLITLLICSLILFFVPLLSYLLSKMLYTPVGRLYKDVQQGLPNKIESTEIANEFEVISRNISTAYSKLHTLQSFKDSNINLLKQELLQNILLNVFEVEDILFLNNPDYDLPFNINNELGVLVLRIDHYLETFCKLTKSDQSLLKYVLANVSTEVMSRQFNCEVVDMAEDHLAIIYGSKSGETELNSKQLVESLIQEISTVYIENFDISFSAGVSCELEFISTLHVAYKKALELTNYRLYYGHGCILFSNELSISQTIESDILNTGLDNMQESLKKANLADAEKHLSTILSSLRGMKYEIVMFSLHRLTSSIFDTLNIIEKNNIVSFHTNYIDFTSHIRQLETIEEIHTEFMKLFKTVIQEINDSKDNKNAFLIEEIIKYINSNYTDPNLSTNVIADIFNLTSAHIGKIFREHTYKSISNYINEVRLEKAAELLVNTSFSVDEIMEKIKWENKKYFFTLFKKQYGATPTQYRLKNINKQS